MAQNAQRDENHVTSILFVGSDGLTYQAKGDEVTGRLYVDMAGGGTGDVTGPATNTDGYIPQWDGANSKDLKDGIDPSTLAIKDASLTQFTGSTAWRIFYSNADGDVTELALGADGTYLKSNGASVAPSFETPSGSGDVVGPESSTDNTIPRFNGITGKLIQSSGITIDDNDYIQMGTGRIQFGGYTDRYLFDSYGFSLVGNTTRPVQVRSTSLLVGINSTGADYGTGNIHQTGLIYQKGTSTGRIIIANANTSATDYTATFPAKDGTVAMTSDIIPGITTTILSGNQSATLSTNTRYVLNVEDGEVQENTLPSTFAVGDIVEIIARIATPPDLIAIYVSSGDYVEFVDENGDIITESSGISFEYSGSVRLVATVANSTWRVASVTGYNVLSSLAAPIRADVNALTTNSTSTVTNKRITPRVYTTTSSATPSINTDNYDAVTITAQAEAITSMTTNLSGTPTNFQKLIIRIKDNGTARAITWGTGFEAKGVALPTTTTLSKVMTLGFIWDSVTSKWGLVASCVEA